MQPREGEFSPAVCCSSWTKRECPSLSLPLHHGGKHLLLDMCDPGGVGDIRDGFPCSASPAGPGPADNTGSASPRSATRLSRDDHPPSVGAGPLPPRQSHASSSAGGSLPAAHNSQGRGRLGGSGGSIGHPPPSQAGATTETAQAEQTQAATHNPAPAAEQEVAMPQPQAHQQQVGAATGGSAAAHRPPTGSQGGNLPPRHSQAAAATGPTRRPQQPMAGGGQMQAQRHNTAAAAAGHQHGTAQPHNGGGQPATRRYMERGGYYAMRPRTTQRRTHGTRTRRTPTRAIPGPSQRRSQPQTLPSDSATLTTMRKGTLSCRPRPSRAPLTGGDRHP